MQACFKPADILLPRDGTDLKKWAVIACDQYTSQPKYWQEAACFVGKSPSSYHLIYPEIYLHQKDQSLYLHKQDGSDPSAHLPDHAQRIRSILEEMHCYLDSGILTPKISQGYILVVRNSPAGTRLGLMGVLDLEQYEFHTNSTSPVKATEETVTERIPPRMKIRKKAPLEVPHAMVLIEDPAYELFAPLYEKRHQLPLLYDTDLMLGGGHISGYAVTGAAADQVTHRLNQMQENCSTIFLAVGDGNHSLAAAKACWDEKKTKLTPQERLTHPARFTLVELVNLYSPALNFFPIHRILYHVDAEHLLESFEEYLNAHNLSLSEGDELCFLWKGKEKTAAIKNRGNRLPVEVLQKFLDIYLKNYPETVIDYIHGKDVLASLTSHHENQNLGIALTAIDKTDLFPAVSSGGALPRKTFSIGEAQDKRYYMECRRI